MTPRLHIATGLAGALLLLAGCGFDPYRCQDDLMCQRGANQGHCTDSGNGSFCTFDDPACPFQLRWDGSAGPGLAGSCYRKLTGGACDPTRTAESQCAGNVCLALLPNKQHEVGLCSQSCQTSTDCGANGECVDVGNNIGTFCFQICALPKDCVDGFLCLPPTAGSGIPQPGCFVIPNP